MSETDRYDSPGKKSARDLVTTVFASTGGTVLDFYGGGRSARAFVEVGLTVTSAEIDRDLHDSLRRDAEAFGYEPFYGRASRIKRTFDCVFADFTGGPSPKTRRELIKLAPMATQWLAVTLSPDRQLDEAVIGPSSAATVPAWVIEATGMRLEYIGRYTRNQYGQWMWIALLTPRLLRRGRQTMLDPLTVAREIQRRRYWASPGFRERFPNLVNHRQLSLTRREQARSREYYLAHRDEKLAYAREHYAQNREKRRQQHRAWAAANPEKAKAANEEWRKRTNYSQSEKRKAYRRAYYLANREKAITQARLYRERQREMKEAA